MGLLIIVVVVSVTVAATEHTGKEHYGRGYVILHLQQLSGGSESENSRRESEEHHLSLARKLIARGRSILTLAGSLMGSCFLR